MKKLLITGLIALTLLVPLLACSPAAPPLPSPTPPPPAGTLAINPPKVEYATIEKMWPAVAKGMGIPEAAVPAMPAGIAVMALPLEFTGTGWPKGDLVTIDLIIPAGVEVPGLEKGMDACGIAFATVDGSGNFKAVSEATAKMNFLLRLPWKGMAPEMAKANPLPAGTYTVRVTGSNPKTMTTATWQLELAKPK